MDTAALHNEPVAEQKGVWSFRPAQAKGESCLSSQVKILSYNPRLIIIIKVEFLGVSQQLDLHPNSINSRTACTPKYFKIMKQAFEQSQPKEQFFLKSLKYVISFCFFSASYLSSWPSKHIWVTSMAHQELGYWFKMEAEMLLQWDIQKRAIKEIPVLQAS